jgi:hypothetical protein
VLGLALHVGGGPAIEHVAVARVQRQLADDDRSKLDVKTANAEREPPLPATAPSAG